VRKTLADARHAIERSQALIARNEELRAVLAETLDLCYQNHVVHESLRQNGINARHQAKKLAKKV